MPEDALIGDELKKMVKVANSRSLAFAFNPPKGEEEPYFAMHRTKSPEVLGRTAKAEGAGTKVAFGTCIVVDRVMSMTCFSELPGLAKRVKRFLKSQNVQVNVRILGPDGTLLEEDIEDLPPDPDAEGPQASIDPETDDPAEAGSASQERAALIDRVRAMSPRVSAAPVQVAERLAPALRLAIEQIKSDALGEAAMRLDQIETALDRLSAQGSPAGTEPSQAAPTPEAAAPDASPEMADATALVQRMKDVQAQLPGMPPAAAGNISAALTTVVGLMKARDFTKADDALTRIEAALRTLATQQGEAPPTPPDPRTEKLQAAADELRRRVSALDGGEALLLRMDAIDTAIVEGEVEAAVGQIKQVQERLRLLAEIERLTPLVSQALSSGAVADPNALRIAFDTAIELASDGDPGRAALTLKQVETMIREGAEDGLSRQDEVGEDVQPFAKARLQWETARATLRSELSRLQTRIREACAGNEELEEVVDGVDDLADYIEGIDARLEDKLDQIVGATSGALREKLKSEARAIIAEHQKELDTPFFRDVDDANGFVPVAVASTARAALADVARVLGA